MKLGLYFTYFGKLSQIEELIYTKTSPTFLFFFVFLCMQQSSFKENKISTKLFYGIYSPND